jgi:hypothetical protein
MTAIELVAAERRRQIFELGRTVENDIEHNQKAELVEAALAYMAMGIARMAGAEDSKIKEFISNTWPWKVPGSTLPEMKDPLENYVKAAALFCAEIDRLLRSGVLKAPDEE